MNAVKRYSSPCSLPSHLNWAKRLGKSAVTRIDKLRHLRFSHFLSHRRIVPYLSSSSSVRPFRGCRQVYPAHPRSWNIYSSSSHFREFDISPLSLLSAIRVHLLLSCDEAHGARWCLTIVRGAASLSSTRAAEECVKLQRQLGFRPG